jgi:hypothetical protein
MACEAYRKPKETLEQRRDRIAKSLGLLEERIRQGQVRVVVGRDGSVTFAGWKVEDREDVADLCAYRKLTAKGSIALRSALARAEIAAGRTVDKQVIGSGLHSHDGGKTWGRH